MPILVQILEGTTRFNEIRRGLGAISPGVLSRRLSELEAAGLIERIEDQATGSIDYIQTPSAQALGPVLDSLALWAQQNIEAEIALADNASSVLMWNVRKYINLDALPHKRSVIRFHFKDESEDAATYWLLATRHELPELCFQDPGLDVDLYVETSVVAYGGIIMGRTTPAREIDKGTFFLSGDPRLARIFWRMLPPSPFSMLPNISQIGY